MYVKLKQFGELKLFGEEEEIFISNKNKNEERAGMKEKSGALRYGKN